MKSWTVFMMAIGFLLIAVSPQMPSSMMYVIVGLVLILVSVIRLKKNSKK